MEGKMARIFNESVDEVVTDHNCKANIYSALHSFHSSQDVRELVHTLKPLLAAPETLVLYEHLRPLVPARLQLSYDRLLPCRRAAGPGVRSATLQRQATGQKLGFAVRGGREHGVGVFVVAVAADSEAWQAGLRPGDQVLRLNGYTLHDAVSLEVANLVRAANWLQLTVKHVGLVPEQKSLGEPITWSYVEESDWERAVYVDEEYRIPVSLCVILPVGEPLGCGVVAVGPAIEVQLVQVGSVAEQAGLEPGDRLLQVNGTRFTHISHSQAVVSLKGSRLLNMTILKKMDSALLHGVSPLATKRTVQPKGKASHPAQVKRSRDPKQSRDSNVRIEAELNDLNQPSAESQIHTPPSPTRQPSSHPVPQYVGTKPASDVITPVILNPHSGASIAHVRDEASGERGAGAGAGRREGGAAEELKATPKAGILVRKVSATAATQTAATPATTPASTPVTKPATAPATTPATTSVTKPVTSAATTPTTTPATTPVIKPATTPVTTPSPASAAHASPTEPAKRAASGVEIGKGSGSESGQSRAVVNVAPESPTPSESRQSQAPLPPASSDLAEVDVIYEQPCTLLERVPSNRGAKTTPAVKPQFSATTNTGVDEKRNSTAHEGKRRRAGVYTPLADQITSTTAIDEPHTTSAQSAPSDTLNWKQSGVVQSSGATQGIPGVREASSPAPETRSRRQSITDDDKATSTVLYASVEKSSNKKTESNAKSKLASSENQSGGTVATVEDNPSTTELPLTPAISNKGSMKKMAPPAPSSGTSHVFPASQPRKPIDGDVNESKNQAGSRVEAKSSTKRGVLTRVQKIEEEQKATGATREPASPKSPAASKRPPSLLHDQLATGALSVETSHYGEDSRSQLSPKAAPVYPNITQEKPSFRIQKPVLLHPMSSRREATAPDKTRAEPNLQAEQSREHRVKACISISS